MATAVLAQPAGTQGDLRHAPITAEFTSLLDGTKKSFGPLLADASGIVSLGLAPGQLNLGLYTARGRLADTTYFTTAAPAPTAVVLNTDALGATVYTLSDLLNMITT